MAYWDFTLHDIKRQLHCIIDATTDLFNAVGEVRRSPWLHETLRATLPLALAVHTEKSRSALLIAPILIELRTLAQHQVSLFSGIDFLWLPVRDSMVCVISLCLNPQSSYL